MTVLEALYKSNYVTVLKVPRDFETTEYYIGPKHWSTDKIKEEALRVNTTSGHEDEQIMDVILFQLECSLNAE